MHVLLSKEWVIKQQQLEVISKLVSLLGDEKPSVSGNARSALGSMGDKAATTEVITKLVSLLGNENPYVKWNACSALRRMGEKAATTQMIAKLVSLLEDEDPFVREQCMFCSGKYG